MSRRIDLILLCLFACISACDEPRPDVETTAETNVDVPSPGTFDTKHPVEVARWDDTESSANLLSNGSFENEAGALKTPWRPMPVDADIRVDAQSAADGKYGLRAQTPFSISQTLRIVDGGEYVVRLLYRTKGSDSSVLIQLEGSSKGDNNFFVESTPLVGRSDAWSLGIFHFYIPAYVHIANLKLSSASEGTVVYIDEVELRRTDALKENWVRNAGFDAPISPRNWGGAVYTKTRRAYPGVSSEDAFCLEISPRASKDFLLHQLVIGLLPGKRYVARGYVRTEGLTGSAYIQITNILQNAQTPFEFNSDSVSGTTNWQLLESAFTLPKGIRRLRFIVRCDAAQPEAGNAGKLWIDHFELVEAGKAE